MYEEPHYFINDRSVIEICKKMQCWGLYQIKANTELNTEFKSLAIPINNE